MLRLALLLAFSLPAGASAQTYTGQLEAGDSTLTTGEYRDEFTVPVQAGQEVSAVVTSADFDTYVILISGSGKQVEDDDCTDGETTRSCAALVADVDGKVRVLVTIYDVGETGEYELVIWVDNHLQDADVKADSALLERTLRDRDDEP